MPGPADEIKVVERMFREFTEQHKTLNAIARGLNEDEIAFFAGKPWTVHTVTNVLKNAKYIGTQVHGRTRSPLSGIPTRVPEEMWAVSRNAFKPIISAELFERTQTALANITVRLSNEQLLEKLKPLLIAHGKLTCEMIEKSRSCPGLSTYFTRFGGLLNAYRQLGYFAPELCTQATTRQKCLFIRASLIQSLLESFPLGQFQEVRKTGRFRALLRYRRTGLLIAVVLAHHRVHGTEHYWHLEAPRSEKPRTAIVGFLKEDNSQIQYYWPSVVFVLHALPSEG